MDDTIIDSKPIRSSMRSEYPKVINHIAISVPDLDRAIKWYKEVFGFHVIAGPVKFLPDNSVTGKASWSRFETNANGLAEFRQSNRT